MSEFDGGYDGGYDGGTDFGHVEAGHENESLNQLHQVDASQNDYDSNFNVYEQDSQSAESTDFQQGHQVEFTNPNGATYAESDFTSYSHDEASADHVFGAEGSESASASDFHQLDALQASFNSAFAEGTELHTGGGAGELGVASN